MTGFELVIEGVPPRKNERHRIVIPKKRKPKGPSGWLANTVEFEAFLLRLTNRWRRAGSPKLRAGTFSIAIVSYWTRMRHLDIDTPAGDVDAPVSAVLDALQMCGAIDDDVRFAELTATKGYDKEHPRVEVTVREMKENPDG